MIGRGIRGLLDSRYDARTPIFVILLVGIGRSMMEYGLVGMDARQAGMSVLSMTAFYTLMFFLSACLLSLLLQRTFEGVANLTAVGLLFGLLPPLIDLASGNAQHQRYIYFTEFTWSLSSLNQPIGETAVLWAMVTALACLVFYLTRSPIRALFGFAGAYGIIQTISLVNLAVMQLTKNGVLRHTGTMVACILLSASLYAITHRRMALAAIKRINHALPHFALALGGAALAGFDIYPALARALTVLFLFLVLLIHNDYYDRREDKLAGREPAADEQDVIWSGFLLLLMIFSLTRISPLLPWLLTGAFLLGMAYHHPALRLKQRFCLSYKIEGGWALMAFLAGTVGELGFPKDAALLWPALMVFGGGSLLSIPKDWKDVSSDREACIPTLYVQLSRKGWSEMKIHLLVTAALVSGLLVPPIVLNRVNGLGNEALLLILPALACGCALLFIRNRKAAVETMLWILSAYLLWLAWLLQI